MADTPGKKPRILCLDDQLEHLQLRKAFLEQFGCEVITINDAQSCLSLASHERFDLALLDYHLAGELTGEDVAHDLRALTPSMPLIMLTGDPALPESVKECVDAYFVKGSSSPKDLLDAIDALLPNHFVKPRLCQAAAQADCDSKASSDGEVGRGEKCRSLHCVPFANSGRDDKI
jgi:CheY-like chemotaxis protein